MREMKDSGIEWIGDIPKDWYVCQFKNIVEEVIDNRGRTPTISEDNNGTPLLELDSIGGKHPRIEKVSKYIDQESYSEFIRKDLMEGDVLFGTVGSVGKCSIVPPNMICCIAQNIVGYRFNSNQVQLFWYYYFQSEPFKQMFMQFNKGNIQSSIKISDMARGTICVPPLEEQERIALYLDEKRAEIDSVIEKTKATIEEYKKLKQSIITEAVTKGIRPNRPMKDSGIEWIGEIPEDWEIVKMKHLGKCRNGLTYSPENLVSEENGVLVLRSSNIRDGKLTFADNVYVNIDIRAELMVKSGDILICSRNGSRVLIGKNALIPEGLIASFGAFMMIFRCQSPKYVQMILNSAVFSYYLGTFLTATINQLTADNFNNMQIVYCQDEAEQKEIIEHLDKKCTEIDNLIAKKTALLTEFETYKKSLIYEYVTGKKEV